MAQVPNEGDGLGNNFIADTIRFIQRRPSFKLMQEVKRVATEILNSNLISQNSKKLGDQSRYTQTITIQPTGTKHCVTVQALDIGSNTFGKDTEEDNLILKSDDYVIILQSDSTKDFILTPFVVITENGESITLNTNDYENPSEAIDAAIVGNYTLKLGEAIVGHKFITNGNKHFVGRYAAFNISSELRKYINSIQKMDMLELEANAPQFLFGFHSYSGQTDIAIVIDMTIIQSWHFAENRSILAL